METLPTIDITEDPHISFRSWDLFFAIVLFVFVVLIAIYRTVL
jgi:hypothetical protein